MRAGLFGALGFVLGLATTYGVAILWNPNYEAALPLIFAGVIVGPILGVLYARHTT